MKFNDVISFINESDNTVSKKDILGGLGMMKSRIIDTSNMRILIAYMTKANAQEFLDEMQDRDLNSFFDEWYDDTAWYIAKDEGINENEVSKEKIEQSMLDLIDGYYKGEYGELPKMKYRPLTEEEAKNFVRQYIAKK